MTTSTLQEVGKNRNLPFSKHRIWWVGLHEHLDWRGRRRAVVSLTRTDESREFFSLGDNVPTAEFVARLVTQAYAAEVWWRRPLKIRTDMEELVELLTQLEGVQPSHTPRSPQLKRARRAYREAVRDDEFDG